MKRAVVVSAFMLALGSTGAHAQCTGWPVLCTGIHLGGGVSGEVAAAIAAWAMGQAIEAAGQSGGSIGGSNQQQIALYDDGNKYLNAAAVYSRQGDCGHAAPLFRKSIPYYQRALALGADDTIQIH